MSDPTSQSPEGLQRIDGQTFDAVLAWLERALRGREPLPLLIPDESLEAPILRRERALSSMTRQDLRDACATLVKRFVHDPRDDDDYVVALLSLATGFTLMGIATDLHQLAADREAFDRAERSSPRSWIYARLCPWRFGRISPSDTRSATGSWPSPAC